MEAILHILAMEATEASEVAGGERKKRVSKSVKAGLRFPVGRISRYLKKGPYSKRVATGAAVYMAGVLQYLAAEVLDHFLVTF